MQAFNIDITMISCAPVNQGGPPSALMIKVEGAWFADHKPYWHARVIVTAACVEFRMID